MKPTQINFLAEDSFTQITQYHKKFLSNTENLHWYLKGIQLNKKEY